MLFVALQKLRPGVRVALPAEMLERVGRRDATNLSADAIAPSASQPLQESATKRVANARGIHDPMRRDCRHMGRSVALDDRTAVLAAGHDDDAAPLEDVVLGETGLL